MKLPIGNPKQQTDILVVDDQETVLTSMVAVLQVGGYAAHGVSNAEEALAFVRDHIPNVLLVDVQLGQSSGIDLAKEIVRKIPGIRVILLTGDPDCGALLDAAQHDGLHFEVMAKPVHPHHLFSLLSAAS